MVFPSRSVADEWWRAVSTSTNTQYSSSIKRVTPHFFTHNPAIANAAYSIVDATVARQFLGRIIFTLLLDRDGRALSTIPSQPDVTDHISGRGYVLDRITK